MPTVTKFPSATQEIAPGWNYPERAYVEDDSCTYSSSDDAEQKYGGWGFTEDDIPAGSNIALVEMGARHYETDTTDFYHYTDMKYVNSEGSSTTYGLTKRSSLTWDWIDITDRESSWDLTKLNNADVRIVMRAVAKSGGGCFPENNQLKTYIICRENGKWKIKTPSQLRLTDSLLVYNHRTGRFESASPTKITVYEGEYWLIEVWSGEVRLPGTDKTWRSHMAATPNHKIRVFKREGDKQRPFAGPIQLTMQQLYQRFKKGENFWTGHLWGPRLEIRMFPITHITKRKYRGKIYGIHLERPELSLFCKTLTKGELETLEKLGFSLEKQTELGPPFMIIVVKLTAYVDAVALRVTYETGAQEILIQDNGAAAETARPTAKVGVSDSGQSVETSKIGLKVADSGFGVETAKLKAYTSALDGAAASEKSIISLKIFEQASSIEKTALQGFAKAKEQASSVESLMVRGAAKTLDQASLIELLKVKASMEARESVVGNEVVGLGAEAKASDFGCATDKSKVGAQISISELVTTTEFAKLSALLKALESSLSFEKPVLKADINVSELGLGVDEASRLERWFGGIRGRLSLQTCRQRLEVETWG